MQPVSVTGNAGIGMPIILLHDAEGGIITVELKNGEVCRGVLDEAEDSMNLVLKVLVCLPLLLQTTAAASSIDHNEQPTDGPLGKG